MTGAPSISSCSTCACRLRPASIWSSRSGPRRRPAPGADLQRHHHQRRRSARARGTRCRRLHQRIQCGATHPPVARAAPVSRQRQPTRSPRVVLGIPVQYRFGDTLAAALTLNLSHGGIAIRTTSPLETGSSVRVRFRLPGSTRDIDAEGRVAWSDGRGSMGIRFEKVEAASQALINTFVDAHFFSNRDSQTASASRAEHSHVPPGNWVISVCGARWPSSWLDRRSAVD